VSVPLRSSDYGAELRRLTSRHRSSKLLLDGDSKGVRGMSIKTKREEIYEQVAELTPPELAELRNWL